MATANDSPAARVLIHSREPRLRLKNMDIGTRDSATFGTGVSATYRATDHYNARFFVDYNLLPSHSRGSREWMSTLAAGLSFAVAI